MVESLGIILQPALDFTLTKSEARFYSITSVAYAVAYVEIYQVVVCFLIKNAEHAIVVEGSGNMPLEKILENDTKQ